MGGGWGEGRRGGEVGVDFARIFDRFYMCRNVNAKQLGSDERT